MQIECASETVIPPGTTRCKSTKVRRPARRVRKSCASMAPLACDERSARGCEKSVPGGTSLVHKPASTRGVAKPRAFGEPPPATTPKFLIKRCSAQLCVVLEKATASRLAATTRSTSDCAQLSQPLRSSASESFADRSSGRDDRSMKPNVSCRRSAWYRRRNNVMPRLFRGGSV
jgi:hypothetical protein